MDFEQVASALRAGQVAVFPTDTVYGVGVSVLHAKTPQVIYQVKRRDSNKAIPWLVGGSDDLTRFGRDIPEYALALTKEFWPGALTVIVNASDEVPPVFRAEDGTVALRMPNDPTALDLISRVGSPLATSSANFQGHMPPYSFDTVDPDFLSQVAAWCGDEIERSGVSSTIVDCTGETPRVIRQGDVIVG